MKLPAAIILLLSATLAKPAHADAIDGQWCHKDGRRMAINGPRIVTPGGMSMVGKYARHAFAYNVPEQEPNAGSRVTMALVRDDTILLFIPGKGPLPSPAKTETWQRCDLMM